MPIEPQQVINSRFGVGLASILGRVVPQRFGYRVADLVADQIAARQEWKMVRAVRANQWVASEEKLKKDSLERAAREVFRNTARSIFDLYHYVHNPEAMHRRIVLNQTAQQLTQRPEYTERGLVVAGIHLSNFDLVLQAIYLQGMSALVLTIPEPQGGYRAQYEMRKKTGMNLVPASASALRHSVKHLQAGGAVLTGVDRPVAAPECRPRFFGRPASLPTHYIYLALKAHVPVMVVAAIQKPDGEYHILTSDLIEMQPHPDRQTELLQNVEAVLQVAEGFIRLAPQQWSMTLPVWPEALDQVPD